MIAKQQDSCDKTAGNGGQNMPMLQGSKIGRSHPGQPFTFDSHQPQSHPRQQARQRHSCRTTPKSPQAAGATRRSCRPRPKVPQGGRRKAPRPPPGPGPATATRPHISPAAPTNNGPHRRPLAAASPQAGAGLSFQNTPQTSAAPCPQLRRSRTRRRTWSRTF